MQQPASLPRIRISLMLLIIVPWSIFLMASVRIWILPEIPGSAGIDAAEIYAIGLALDNYKDRYGEYPPDFSSGNPRKEIDDHLRRIFPQRDADRDVPPNIDQLGPDNALAFWLNGFYDANPRCPLTGQIYLGQIRETERDVWIEIPAGGIWAEVYDGDAFAIMMSEGIMPIDVSDRSAYEDIAANLSELLGSKKDTLELMLDRAPIFHLDPARLSAKKSYRPQCCSAPLVYFCARSYATATFSDNPRWGVAAPYQTVLEDGTKGFERPVGCQVICAGRDNYFGRGSIVTDKAGAYEGHADNFTSFHSDPIGIQPLIAARDQAYRGRSLSLLTAIVCTLAYPLTFLLAREESGLVVLSRITNRQVGKMHCSDQWQAQLDAQKRARRSRAIGRFRSKWNRPSKLRR